MKRKKVSYNNLFELEEEEKELNPPPKQKEELEYYEISSFPYGGGYGGTSYIRLEDSESTILDNRVTIEILWPNGNTTQHKITTTSKSSSFYDRGACTTFNDTNVWAHVDIECNGAKLKNVKLNEIDGIKARIVDRKKYSW